jgi:SOS-response transcriptional repressor LexA
MPRPRKCDDDEILAAIVRLTSKGPAPTLRELAAEVGLSSPTPLLRYLERLRQEGKVSWEPGKARTLRVVERVVA